MVKWEWCRLLDGAEDGDAVWAYLVSLRWERERDGAVPKGFEILPDRPARKQEIGIVNKYCSILSLSNLLVTKEISRRIYRY